MPSCLLLQRWLSVEMVRKIVGHFEGGNREQDKVEIEANVRVKKEEEKKNKGNGI